MTKCIEKTMKNIACIAIVVILVTSFTGCKDEETSAKDTFGTIPEAAEVDFSHVEVYTDKNTATEMVKVTIKYEGITENDLSSISQVTAMETEKLTLGENCAYYIDTKENYTNTIQTLHSDLEDMLKNVSTDEINYPNVKDIQTDEQYKKFDIYIVENGEMTDAEESLSHSITMSGYLYGLWTGTASEFLTINYIDHATDEVVASTSVNPESGETKNNLESADSNPATE